MFPTKEQQVGKIDDTACWLSAATRLTTAVRIFSIVEVDKVNP